MSIGLILINVSICLVLQYNAIVTKKNKNKNKSTPRAYKTGITHDFHWHSDFWNLLFVIPDFPFHNDCWGNKTILLSQLRWFLFVSVWEIGQETKRTTKFTIRLTGNFGEIVAINGQIFYVVSFIKSVVVQSLKMNVVMEMKHLQNRKHGKWVILQHLNMCERYSKMYLKF